MTRLARRSLASWIACMAVVLSGPVWGQTDASERGITDGQPNAAEAPREGGRGGAALADFDSLMTLIKSTVAPDTWEDLGGPSTIAPYPGGIAVQAAETLGALAPAANTELQRQRSEALSGRPSSNTDWRARSELRKVSLTRLRDAVQARRAAGKPLEPAMRSLAGLSRISHVFLSEDASEVVLAGKVGGVIADRALGPVDAQTGWPTLRLDDLAPVAAASFDGRSLGCSIEPTAEGITAAVEVAERIGSGQLSAARAPDALARAMGPQEVRLFGVGADMPLAVALLAVDVHMKRMALDQEKMPVGLSSYFDIVADTIADGAPDGQVLRLWFAPRGVTVNATPDGRAMSWEELPVQLMSERQWADATGRRVAAGNDPRAEHFAATFTADLERVVRQHPLYGRMTAAFEMALVCELLRRNRRIESPQETLGILARPDEWLHPVGLVPQRIESLVAGREIRQGRRRYNVLVVSGGVQVTGPATLAAVRTDRPTSMRLSAEQALAEQPRSAATWWWD